MAVDSPTTRQSAAPTSHLLLRSDTVCERRAITVRTASAPPSPANTPKWWVHLVGVNTSSNKEPAMTPRSRRDGPPAAPGTRPRRSITAVTTAMHISMSRTGNRRATPPSAETPNRASQRSFSPYQGRLGPSSVRMRVASRTVARV